MFFFLVLGIVFDSFFLNVSVIRRVFFGWLHARLQGHNCLVPATVPKNVQFAASLNNLFLVIIIFLFSSMTSQAEGRLC